jgi:hypothetical protein
MTDIHSAILRAPVMQRSDYLRAEPLRGSGAVVAYFETDRGLRSLGQTSLIQSSKGGYGIVISQDGSIPDDETASRLIRHSNSFKDAPDPES